MQSQSQQKGAGMYACLFYIPQKYEGTHWDVLAATGTDSGGSGERAGGAAPCQSLVISSQSLFSLGRAAQAEEAPPNTCA